ncbi:MAG: DNA gyrase inhibitor YacG [Rhodobacteraceae bacterium]|nr:DNA gyrase inhibitor YacG [Paracoccaceae bacterium]
MKCPICRRKTDQAYRPFCSRRCADVDLGYWLAGHYAVPSDDPGDIEAADEATVRTVAGAARRPP